MLWFRSQHSIRKRYVALGDSFSESAPKPCTPARKSAPKNETKHTNAASRQSTPKPCTGSRKSALQHESLLFLDSQVKLRITFVKDEIGLQPVFLRLAYLPDEGARARAIRAALSMLHETTSMPRWFLSLPETTGSLPRSFTVRVVLLGSDPSLGPVIGQLARMPEDERSSWIKNLMARSLGRGPGGIDPHPAGIPIESGHGLPSYTPTPEVLSQNGITAPSDPPAADEAARTRLNKNALKAFDLDLLQNSPT